MRHYIDVYFVCSLAGQHMKSAVGFECKQISFFRFSLEFSVALLKDRFDFDYILELVYL